MAGIGWDAQVVESITPPIKRYLVKQYLYSKDYKNFSL